MRTRSWKILAAIAVMAFPFGVQGQTNDELSAMVTGPWHHVPNAVSPLQFNKDEAKCRVVSAQTPINSTTPAVVERVRWTVLINCLKASGYEPGPALAKTKTAPPQDTPSAAKITLMVAKIEDLSCAQFLQLRKITATADYLFFAWARGFITAWNVLSENAVLRVDPSVIQSEAQQKLLQDYCAANPSKMYMESVSNLLAKLKYEKAKATGKVEEQ
jgi:hypothetical protein